MSAVSDNGGPCSATQSRVENGKETTVGVGLLQVWAKNLQVSVGFLMGHPPRYHVNANACAGQASDVGDWVREHLHTSGWSDLASCVRLRLVLERVARHSEAFTPVSLAYTLHLDLKELEKMMNGRDSIPETQVKALATLTRLPESWLLIGDKAELEVPSYHPAIILAYRKGISPAQLMAKIEEL